MQLELDLFDQVRNVVGTSFPDLLPRQAYCVPGEAWIVRLCHAGTVRLRMLRGATFGGGYAS